VGSRKHSQYGNKVISHLICSLSIMRSSLVIISGLALGIDALVHEKCIEYGMRTAAILPLGLNRITPVVNEKLYYQILDNNGVVIAEDLKVEKFHKYHFPRRNRIIAGISSITIIIEAGYRSGAVMTANYAFQENREVLAVPGNIFSPFSIGSNKLIGENKAQIYGGPEQVLEELFKWDNR
jgi:DNA processing protein